jgi:hypothetical protein
MSGYAEEKPVPNQKGVWYRFDMSYCPICASGEWERTRQLPPKPEDPNEIYHIEERWDYCDAL